MSWDRETWRLNVADMLFEMSNVNFQEAIWTGKIPGLTHSFSELICNLEDYAIPDGLNWFVNQKICTRDEAECLNLISKRIDELIKKYPRITDWDVNKIIANEEWLAIVSTSKTLFDDDFKSDFVSNNKNKNLVEEWC